MTPEERKQQLLRAGAVEYEPGLFRQPDGFVVRLTANGGVMWDSPATKRDRIWGAAPPPTLATHA